MDINQIILPDEPWRGSSCEVCNQHTVVPRGYIQCPACGWRPESKIFTAEASTLGWKVGEVKEFIDFKNERFNYARATKTEDGETVSWHYVSSSGSTITVFND